MSLFRKTEKYTVSPALQKVFVVSMAAAVLTSGLTMAPYIFLGDVNFSDLSWLLSSYILKIFMPIVFFVVAYLLIPKNIAVLPRVFESTLLAAIGIALGLVITYVTGFWFETIITDAGMLETALYQLGPNLLTLLAFTGTLMYLRNQKQWR